MGWTVLYLDPAWTGFDPRAVAAADETAIRIKSTGSTAVYPFVDAGRSWIVKRRRVTGLRRWRVSRARRAVATAAALGRAGIRTPTVRAAFERRRWGALVGSWLVTDRIDGETVFERLGRDAPGDPARLAAAAAVGDLIGHTFGAGYRNRDWKAPNIVLDRASVAWVVDLDGVRHVGRVDPATRRRDLARFARDAWAGAPPTDEERRVFWTAYRRGHRAGRAAAGTATAGA